MRKKITALGLLLLSMIGFTANAQTFTWSLQEGETVESFLNATLTITDIPAYFDGNYAATNDCGLYRADGTQVSSFGWGWCPYTLEIVDGKLEFLLEVQYDAVAPDYPVTTAGDYYLRICPGFFRYGPDNNSENAISSEELRLNFKIEPVAGYVSASDITITPEAGVLKSCPEQWTITINKDDLTKTELTEDARFEFYANSWTVYELIPTISEDGKTITLTPGADEYGNLLTERFGELNAGVYKVIIYKNSLKFNDDESKTNDLIQIEYEIPETCRYNTSKHFPQAGKVSSLKEFELYFFEQGATVEIPAEATDWSNVPYIAYYDSQFNVWMPIVFFDSEVIPSEKDENGYWTYPGVKLTMKEDYAAMTFPEGEYKLVAPYGAYIVTTLETDWDESKVMDTQYFEDTYQLAVAPEFSSTPVWGFEDGHVFDSFSETTVTFAGLKNVELFDKYDQSLSPELIRVKADGKEEVLGNLSLGYYDESSWSDIIEPDENGTIRVYMMEDRFAPYYPIESDGDYKIKMKRGFLKMEGFNDLTNEASEITFKVQSNTLLKEVNSSIDPAPCEITAYPQRLVITFDNDEIQTLKVNELEEKYWGYDENGNWNELTRTVQATAELVQTYEYYSWACGQYLIEVNPENPKQIILTPDPSSISEDAVLQYGNYKFRIKGGALTANEGLETECKNTIMEWGLYSYVQRFNSEIVLPLQNGEVQTDLKDFYVKYTDNNGYEAWGTPEAGEGIAQLFVYDEVKADWLVYSDLNLNIDNSTGVNNYIFSLDYPVTTSGRYKVVIPRNAVMFNDWGTLIHTEACEAEYVVESEEPGWYEYTTNPEEGNVPFIDDIELRFQNPMGVYVASEDWSMYADDAAVVINSEGEIVAYGDVSTAYEVIDGAWFMYQLIDFEPVVKELGDYRVVVGRNVFDTDYDNIGDSDAIEFKYTVVGGDPILSVSPADGSVLETLTNFTFSWAGATEVVVDPTLMVGGAKLYAEITEGTKELYSDIICSPAGAKSVVLDIMDLSKPMENGKYILDVPAALFTVDGKANDAMSFTYTLNGPTYEVEVLEAPFNKIRLTVGNVKEIKINEECADDVTLWYTTSGEEQVGKYIASEPVNNTVEFTLEDANVEFKDGDYVIWLPAEYFWVGNYKSRDVKFAIEGYVSVEEIAEDTNFDVYSVNGMVIKRNANKADVKDLDPGVYVINGKKVLVK